MAARRSTLRGPQAPTAQQKKKQGFQDIADVGEGGKQKDFARKQQENAAKRKHESGERSKDRASDLDITLAGQGVVRKKASALTAGGKRRAQKKFRDNKVREIRARQAFEERKRKFDLEAEISTGTGKADPKTFRGGAPIRIQTRKGGPTHEFTRGLIQRGGDPLAAAQKTLREDSDRARGDFDISTGRAALERQSSRDKKVRDVAKGIGGDRPTASQQRRIGALGNVTGSDGIADILRMNRVLKDRGAPPAAAPVAAQAPAPAPVAPVAPVPPVAPATTVPTPVAQPTVAGAPQPPATPAQAQGPLDENSVNVLLSDPNLQAFLPSMSPQQQQQLSAELERRLNIASAPPVAAPVAPQPTIESLQARLAQLGGPVPLPAPAPPAAQPAPVPPPPPPAFARPFAIPQPQQNFGTAPGATPPPIVDFNLQRPDDTRGFERLPSDPVKLAESKARIAEARLKGEATRVAIDAGKQQGGIDKGLTQSAATTNADVAAGSALTIDTGSGFGVTDPLDNIRSAAASVEALLGKNSLTGAARLRVVNAIKGSELYAKAQKDLRDFDDMNDFFFALTHGYRKTSSEGSQVRSMLIGLVDKIDSAASPQAEAAPAPSRPVEAPRG